MRDDQLCVRDLNGGNGVLRPRHGAFASPAIDTAQRTRPYLRGRSHRRGLGRNVRGESRHRTARVVVSRSGARQPCRDGRRMGRNRVTPSARRSETPCPRERPAWALGRRALAAALNRERSSGERPGLRCARGRCARRRQRRFPGLSPLPGASAFGLPPLASPGNDHRPRPSVWAPQPGRMPGAARSTCR